MERPVASAAYGFVRFIGGGLAPFFAGEMVDAWGISVPFLVGAGAVALGVAVLATGHGVLAAADAGLAGGHGQDPADVAGEVADEFGGAPAAVGGEVAAEHARAWVPLRWAAPARGRTTMTSPSERPRVATGLDGDVWTVTLDRPEAGNAIDPAMAAGLAAALDARPAGARAVLLLGRGERFCVGGDVRAFAGTEDLPGFIGRLAEDWHAVVRRLLDSPVPVVAGVHGAVAGAGVGLVGACDVVVSARSTRFRPAYGALGLSPDGGSSWVLARTLGAPLALDLMLTDGTLTAVEAHRYGLVARLVEDEELPGAAAELAARVAAGPVRAMVRTRGLVRRAAVRTAAEQLDDEARLIAESAADPEGREGVRAFVEKRTPDFR